MSPTASLSLSVLEKDKNFLLDLSPIYEMVRLDISKKLSADRVQFSSLDGNASALMYELLSNSERGNYHYTLREIDSLILSGEYHIANDTLLYCTLLLSTTTARTVATTTFEIDKGDAPPSLRATLFLPLSSERLYSEIQYRGRVIGALEKMIQSNEANFFYAPAKFNFILLNPYANRRQLGILKEVLSFRYGVTFSPKSSAKITIGYEGVMTIERKDKSVVLSDIIDGEPLFPESYIDDMATIKVPIKDIRSGNVIYEEFEFESHDTYISDLIVDIFETNFPKLFTPVNAPELHRIFRNKENSILVGSLLKSDHLNGIENVRYKWSSARSWINRLVDLESKGRRFSVKTKVMKIFRDEISSERFWAVVKQDWNTEFAGINTYEDVGFLIVSFDFDLNDKELKDFKIAYRLWFYNYRYKELETSLGRVEKLKHDLNTYFLDSHLGVSGISEGLKDEIVTFILQKADEVDRTLILQ